MLLSLSVLVRSSGSIRSRSSSISRSSRSSVCSTTATRTGVATHHTAAANSTLTSYWRRGGTALLRENGAAATITRGRLNLHTTTAAAACSATHKEKFKKVKYWLPEDAANALQLASQYEPREDTHEEWMRYRHHLERLFGEQVGSLLCTNLQIVRTFDQGGVPSYDLWHENLHYRASLGVGVKELVQQMKDSGVSPTLETYQLLISGTVTSDSFDDCWESYQEMKKQGFKPDLYVFARIVAACEFHGQPGFITLQRTQT